MPKGENQSSLPSFVVIGATRAGTETLNAWLNDHPDVCMSPREGLDFFLEDGTWGHGRRLVCPALRHLRLGSDSR